MENVREHDEHFWRLVRQGTMVHEDPWTMFGLLEDTVKHTPGGVSKSICYRGHGSTKYSLIPNAYRPMSRVMFRRILPYKLPAGAQETTAAQVLCEAYALKLFIDECCETGLDIPELTTMAYDELSAFIEQLADALLSIDKVGLTATGDALHHLRSFGGVWPARPLHRMLAIAQHSGIPTRLLDWTYNPMVAAYFAASDCCELHSRVPRDPSAAGLGIWRLNVDMVNELNRNVQTSERCVPRFQIIRVLGPGNANLRAQAGLFLVPFVDLSKEGTSVFEPTPFDQVLNHGEDIQQWPLRLCHVLYRCEANVLLGQLSGAGWNAARLFPNYSGVGRRIEELSRCLHFKDNV